MSVRHLITTAGLALALMTGAASAAPVVFNYTGGFQSFTAGATGIYDITAIGAQGGTGFQGGTGGLGAKVAGDFTLTKGEVLSILVGGRGQDGLGAGGFDSGGGGGGGSYVNVPGSQNNYLPLAVAGGGGGGGPDGLGNGIAGQAGRSGTASNPDNNEGGTNGTGGSTGFGGTGGSGGAGEFTRGGDSPEADSAGGAPPYLKADNSSPQNIPAGYGGDGEFGGNGGFGGGGGGSFDFSGGGGGGGYSGGAGGSQSGGGGAGSFLADGTPINRDFIDLGGVNSGDGLISIDLVSSTGAVPEIPTWTMLLLGFGGTGFLAHRRSRKSNVLPVIVA